MNAFTADLRRRPLWEWAVRAFAAAAVGAVGYVAVTQSLAMALPAEASARAHALAPSNALITAELSRLQLATELATGNISVPYLAGPERLARQALRRDPTAISAVATLGQAAQLRGETARARQLLSYAERLSRRDLPTQLWLIEDAVSRQDTGGALRHYDIALRTKRSAPDLLFPVLAGASTDPAIAGELARTLSTRPAWGPAFLLYLAGNTPDARATAQLFTDLGRAGTPVAPPAKAALINGLVGAGAFDVAWNYYATVHRGAQRGHSRDADFSAALESPTVFDWIPAVADTGLSANIQAGLLDFSAQPSLGGLLVQQAQVLPPGRYILEGHSTGIDQPSGSQPFWALNCRIGGRRLGQLDLPNSSQNDGRFVGQFVVPHDCPAQDLILFARASDGPSGLSGQIDRVQLRPAK